MRSWRELYIMAVTAIAGYYLGGLPWPVTAMMLLAISYAALAISGYGILFGPNGISDIWKAAKAKYKKFLDDQTKSRRNVTSRPLSRPTATKKK